MTQKQIKLDDYFLKRTEQYVHPNNFTGYSSGLYKITTNTNGHVTNAQSVSGEDLPLHNHNSSISYGQVDSTSTSTVFTATVPNLTELIDGTTVMLRNGVVTSASGFTLNVNNLGAKPVYNSMADLTRDTTIFNIAYTMLFVYDSTRVDGGCWICYRGYDANTNTIGYQIRTNSTPYTATDKGYKYRLWLETTDNKYMPVNTSTSTNATANRSSSMNTREFWIGGNILYNSTNGTTNANATMSATTLWKLYTLSLGYSFNNTGSALVMTFPAPVYMVAKPTSNGKARLNTPFYTQTLPSTEDGKLYIYLGHAYSETNIELALDHPVYEYKNGSIRLYQDTYSIDEVDDLLDGKSDTNHTHTKSQITDFPTIPTKTSDLTNDSNFLTSHQSLTNYIQKSNTNGLIKNDGTIDTNTYLTSHQDISGKANTADLGEVAFSNDYEDLDNLPTIPSAYTHPTTHPSSMITDSNTHSNIGNTTNTLENIITNIDTKLSSFANVDLIEVTSSLGTASANTMNKLYLVAETTSATNDNYEIFVTVRTGTSGNYSYNWEKVDTARIDLSNYLTTTNAQQTYVAKENGKGLSSNDYTTSEKNKLAGLHTVATSGSYNDLTNKPTIPSASTTVPSADTTNGAYGSGTTYARANHQHPKSSLYAEATHNHTKSQITDLSIPSKTSDLTNDSNFISTSSTNGLIKNDGSIDTSSYITSSAITSHNSNASAHSSLFNGKANSVHTHSTSDITDLPAIPSDLEDLTDNTGILHFNDYIAYDDMSGVPLSDFNNDLIKLEGASGYTIIQEDTDNGTQIAFNEKIIYDYVDTEKVYYDVNGNWIDPDNEIATKGDIPVITGKENSANKVSSWSATTNNTRYPSEKLVKDSLDAKLESSDLVDELNDIVLDLINEGGS